MGTTLSTLAPAKGANKKRKRVGRGPGSGTGKTAGRGQKGQKARSGHHGTPARFEGGQMPMHMRLPKRGFKPPFRTPAFPVNVQSLAAFDGTVDLEGLRKAGLVPKKAKIIKILGGGDLSKKLTVKAHAFSKSAREKIESAGGVCEVLPTHKPKAEAKAE